MSDRQRTCSKCKAPMRADQDWCLQCGQGAPKSLRGGPGWRSAAAALGGSAVLALGAAAAAYAAFQKEAEKPAGPTVAQTPSTTVPSTPAEVPAEGGTTNTPTSPGSAGSQGEEGFPFEEGEEELPSGKEGEEEAFPFEEGEEGNEEFPFGEEGKGHKGKGKGSGQQSEGKNGGNGKSGGNGGEGKEEGKGSSGEEGGQEGEPGSGQQGGGKNRVPTRKAPILLDTNAAHVYNPREYPSGLLSDPSRAIDGEVSTSWTVQLRAETAPKVGVGLVLDLKSLQKVAKIALIAPAHSQPVRVQIYGTSDRKRPQALKSKRWVKLSSPERLTKRRSAIYMRHYREAFRQLLVWIIEAPESASKATASSSTSTSSSSIATAATPSATVTTTSTSSTSTGQSQTTTDGTAGKVSISEIELYAPKPGA